MQWVTAALAVYGAGLSSCLGYLTWRRERHRLHFAPRFYMGEHRRLVIVAVNTGHRPVALSSAHFEQDDGGGYLPTLDESLGLPCTLAEGESLHMAFDADDLWPGTSAFVLQGYGRAYRYNLSDMREHWEAPRSLTG